MITSTQNTKIKWVRSLQTNQKSRRQQNAFVVEGVRLAEEALNADWEVELVLYTDELSERGKSVLSRYDEKGVSMEKVTPHVMRAVSDTQIPQGILGVVTQRDLPLPDEVTFIFIPDLVRDPGNLGSMLRTSAAAGVQVVFIPPETVDPFLPKVIRGGMGAHFRLPIRILSWEEIGSCIKSLQVYLAAAELGVPYTDADFCNQLALIVGGEAVGASSKAKKLAHTCLHIPMPGGGESLNAGIAAGVLLFEVARQRSVKRIEQRGST
jgi:TrmH family RNA methyltransferase